MVSNLDPRELSDRLRRGPANAWLLLDVREDEERAIGSIEPSVHIPMGEIPDRLTELPRDRQIVVYCHYGQRSAMVAEFLLHEGFEQVFNLQGGIDAWSTDIDPAVPRYG